MTNYSLFASMPVRKVVNGDSISPYFTTNGVALFQGVNPDTGTPTPSWETDGSCPVITPHAGSAKGVSYTLTSHAWKYNGNDLKFSAGGSGWEQSSVNNKFWLNHTDGSLKILGNLASKTNADADSLEYSGVAVYGDFTYDVSKTIDIFISPLGSSSFGGYVNVSTTAIGTINGALVESAKIMSAGLYNSNGSVGNFTIKVWRGMTKDNDHLIGTYASGKVTDCVIDRSKVDGQEVFVVEFYVDGTSAPVYTTGFTIIDIDDLYQLYLYDAGKGIDDNGGTSIFRGFVMKVKSNTEYDSSKVSGTVAMKLAKGGSSEVLKSGSLSYADFRNTGFTITAADIADNTNSEVSCSINVEANVTLTM